MLKKILSMVVVCLLMLSTSSFLQTFAQTSDILSEKQKPQVKFTREYLLKSYSSESKQAANYNFEKDAFNQQVKKNNLSGTAKTALIVGVVAAVAITLAIIVSNRNVTEVRPPDCNVPGPC